MIKIDTDIFVFERIIPKDIISELLKLRGNDTQIRIDIDKLDMSLFHKINDFWFLKIENNYLEEYFKIYDVENNVGFNVNYETIKSLKEYVKTIWRDLYMLYYSPETYAGGSQSVHWDFSNITMVGGLDNDYEGGELVFPRQNVQYRLNEGDIVIFPGGLTHPHYVNSVTKGKRNVIVGQSMTIKQDHQINY